MVKEGQGQSSPSISPIEIYPPTVHLPVSDAYFTCPSKEPYIQN